MDPLWILAAFALGFGAYRLNLPPMVGYLIAGFLLQALGVEGGEGLENIANLGVLLLLFTIGLKLNVRTLLQPAIWIGASFHMLVTVGIFGFILYLLLLAGLSVFSSLNLSLCLLLAFALSFSSTVFAVKILEEKGEMGSLHGKLAIGILIMQDIFAVLFLTVTTGKIPSPWAVVLIAGLLILRPALHFILNKAGHRELLLLFSVFLALGLGAGGFELVHLKPDLGALILGILIAGHPKAGEMADSLLSFKDLFLVGFFLSIGLSGAPTMASFAIATLLVLAIPIKFCFFFLIFTYFKLRPRTSLLTALTLANYSEFGLLVAALVVKNGWLGNEWLVTIAVALSMSFIIASPLNSSAHLIYDRFATRLRRFEPEKLLPEDQPLDPGNAEIVVFGMGRVGTATYDNMRQRHGDIVLGVDFDNEKVALHQQQGRKVLLGDAKDIDFWSRVQPKSQRQIQLVMLAMADHNANMQAVKELSTASFQGLIAATAQFDDEVEELKNAGVHVAFNFYAQAGCGFADHTSKSLEKMWRFDPINNSSQNR